MLYKQVLTACTSTFVQTRNQNIKTELERDAGRQYTDTQASKGIKHNMDKWFMTEENQSQPFKNYTSV